MSQKLFDLIKSLTKNEKGYYRKFSSIYSNEDNIYNKLFDKIEKQKDFDEDIIKKTLFKEHNKTNYYNVVKNYLYNTILKSLRSYHANKKVAFKINTVFNNIAILYRKKLISQCVKELKKGRKLILENEKFENGFELIVWERRLLALKGFSTKYSIQEAILEKQRIEYDTKADNLGIFSHYQYDFFSIALQMGTRNNEKDLKKLKDIIFNKYFKDDSFALSKRSKLILYNTKSKYFEVIEDNKNFYAYSEKFVNLLDDNQFLVSENVENLVNGTYNLLIACAYLKDKEKFYYHFKKFNNIPNKYSRYCSKELKNLVSFYALNVLLFFLVYIEDFEAAYELNSVDLPLSEKEMVGVFKLIYIELLYFTAYISFSLGKNQEAQDWLNRILDFPNTIFRKDILIYAKMLDLLNHYDLENYKLVENLLDSTTASLSKLKRTYKFDKLILKLLSNLLKSKTKKQKKQVLLTYQSIFKELKKDKSESAAFQHINILRWIRLKLENN